MTSIPIALIILLAAAFLAAADISHSATTSSMNFLAAGPPASTTNPCTAPLYFFLVHVYAYSSPCTNKRQTQKTQMCPKAPLIENHCLSSRLACRTRVLRVLEYSSTILEYVHVYCNTYTCTLQCCNTCLWLLLAGCLFMAILEYLGTFYLGYHGKWWWWWRRRWRRRRRWGWWW